MSSEPTTTPPYAQISSLTPAEQAILDEALGGRPARDIAERLSLTEATVRTHLSHIYLKLGVSGRVALLASFRDAPPGDVAAPASQPGRRRIGRAAALGTLAAVAAAAIVFVASVVAVGNLLDTRAQLANPFRPVATGATQVPGAMGGARVIGAGDATDIFVVRSPFGANRDPVGAEAGPGVAAAVVTLLPFALVLAGLGFVLARVSSGIIQPA